MKDLFIIHTMHCQLYVPAMNGFGGRCSVVIGLIFPEPSARIITS